MEHSEFHIGIEFYTAAGRWRCTDVGTRVITAISLESQQVVAVRRDAVGDIEQGRHVSDDARGLDGPPYAVAEIVFDEQDLGGCYRTADEIGSGELKPPQESSGTANQRERGPGDPSIKVTWAHRPSPEQSVQFVITMFRNGAVKVPADDPLAPMVKAIRESPRKRKF